MRRLSLIMLIAAFSFSLAEEKIITRTEAPAAVIAAFQKSYSKAVIEAVTEEIEDSVTYFEITSNEAGIVRDVLYTVDGTVVVVETTILAADLPAAVSKSLNTMYPKANIEKAETLLKDNVTSYEVLLKSGKNYYEVALAADGTITETEDKGETLDDND